MSVVAALIADMVNAGISADIIGRVAAALAQREPLPVLVKDEQAERRREKDRDRKRLRNSADSAEFPPSPKDPVLPLLTTVEVIQTPPTPLSPPAPSKPSKPTKAKRAEPAYSTAFLAFWSGYPTDKNMSKAEAWPAWGDLAAEDQVRALSSLPAFRAYCAGKPDYRPVHAVRYLKYRRFDGYSEAAPTPSLDLGVSVPVAMDAEIYAPLLYRYRKENGHDPPMNGKTASFPDQWVQRAKQAYGAPQ